MLPKTDSKYEAELLWMVLIASGIFVISLGNSGSSEFKIAKAMVALSIRGSLMRISR